MKIVGTMQNVYNQPILYLSNLFVNTFKKTTFNLYCTNA